LRQRGSTWFGHGLAASFSVQAQGEVVVIRGPLPPQLIRTFGVQMARQLERSLKQAASYRAMAAAAR
jgi:hypothetical protein